MPTIPFIPTLHVGRGQAVGAVTLFPVWCQIPAVPGLVTGPAAPIEVGEVPGGPSVDHLSVHNPGTRPVLLVEGELFEGGWQTRASVRDVVVRPGARIEVEVVCVEQHRWQGAGSHARRARRTTASVQRRLRAPEPVRQSSVWDGVRRHESTIGTATGSLADHLDRVDDLTCPPPLDGQKGVIVGVAGQPVALELFGTRMALAAHLPGILAAAALEAELCGPAERVPSRRARRFAQRVAHTPWTPVDLGSDTWAGQTDRVDLRALTVGRGLAHLAAVACAR